MSQMPPPVEPTPGMVMRPHRGVAILVLAILSWFLGCFVLGIIAWVMGNTDLQAMAEGQMDPSGEGITKAGKIVGMIHVIVSLVAIPIIFIAWLILVVFAAAAATGGGGTP